MKSQFCWSQVDLPPISVEPDFYAYIDGSSYYPNIDVLFAIENKTI